MKKIIKSIIGGVFILIVLTGMLGLFVRLLQIGFFPDVRYFVLVSRCTVVIIALPIASSMFWFGLALILKYSLDSVRGVKKKNAV
jgi:hypothetical protein